MKQQSLEELDYMGEYQDFVYVVLKAILVKVYTIKIRIE